MRVPADLDSKTFHERLERRAIELSFSSTRDYFRGSLRMLKDNKDEAFDLLHMALTSPHFDAPDVERIRAQVLSSLRRESTSPNSLAARKFLEIAFGDHPYGRPSTGTLDSVPKIEVTDLKDYVAACSPGTRCASPWSAMSTLIHSANCSTRRLAACPPRPA